MEIELERIYQSLSRIAGQIERAEAILKTWPHARLNAATVHVPCIGRMYYVKPHLVIENNERDGEIVPSPSWPAMWRIDAALAIPKLFENCNSLAAHYLEATEQAGMQLEEFLDNLQLNLPGGQS